VKYLFFSFSLLQSSIVPRLLTRNGKLGNIAGKVTTNTEEMGWIRFAARLVHEENYQRENERKERLRHMQLDWLLSEDTNYDYQ